AALAGGAQVREHPLTGGIEVEDVGFEVHAAGGLVHGLAKCREELAAVTQQVDAVAVAPDGAPAGHASPRHGGPGRVGGNGQACHAGVVAQGNSSSAKMGAWSDNWRQGSPCSTRALRTAKPRW